VRKRSRPGQIPRPTRPRLQLALVALLAVVTLVALGLARPEFGGAALHRGRDVALIAAWVVACAASAWLLFATGICVVVALATAWANPFSVLVPMLPLGLAAMWGARYGVYPTRRPPAVVKGARR